MEKFLQFISPLKIPTEILLGMFLLVSTILTFMPNNILSKLALDNFVQNNQFVISIILLCSLSYFIVVHLKKLYVFLKNKIRQYNYKRIGIKNIESLSAELKEKIARMYNGNKTGYLEINDPNTGLLTSMGIICRASNLSAGSTTFGYFLQPWVVEYLDKNYSKFINEDNK